MNARLLTGALFACLLAAPPALADDATPDPVVEVVPAAALVACILHDPNEFPYYFVNVEDCLNP